MILLLNTLQNKKIRLEILLVIFIIFIIFILFLASCGKQRAKNPADYYINNIIRIAKRIAIIRFDNYTRVTIVDPWQGADNVNMVYYLVPRGSEPPSGIDSTSVIFVPLRKIVCMSTTHVAMISALGEGSTIAGMSGTGLIYSRELIARANEGYIKDVGYEANLNKEMILQIRPDLTMIYGIGSESSGYVGKIKELGIRVIYNADYLETDPVGKAEWIRLFGALYCRERLADSIFNAEAEAYNTLKLLIEKNITNKPRVLLGLPFKDTWFISPGNSFISKMIGDAGGEYLWKDTKSLVSMPYGLENVYMKAIKAEFWLNIGTVKTKKEIIVVDQRLREFPCFKKGNLFNNNNRVNESGGNDFWEEGTLYPHLILHDIAAILHPDLFPGNELCFYRKIY
jgi:iron complex transport system substrate-binding protein